MGPMELQDFLNTPIISSFFFPTFIVCQRACSGLQKKSSAAQFPRIASFGFPSTSSLVKKFPFSVLSLDMFRKSSPTHKIVVEVDELELVDTIFHCRIAVTDSRFSPSFLRIKTSSSLSLDF